MTKREMALMILGVFVLGVFAGVCLSCAVYLNAAEAEEESGYCCWVLCKPGTEVLVRAKPAKKGEIVGAVDCGDRMLTDWTEKDGWIHVIQLANETGEGWVSSRYIVWSEPEMIGEERSIESGGRVACRKWIDGKRTAWIAAGSRVQVYAMADGWAVTNRGYIQSRYIGGAE